MLKTFLKYLFSLFIFQGLLLSSTYNLAGLVLDAESQKPISNASIYIVDQNIGTTSDEEGYFNLLLNNYYLDNKINLKIQVIGYQEKEMLVFLSKGRNDLGEILLKAESIKLESIEIHSHENKSKQISDIVIEGKELNENLKGNIATSLANYPNIGINSFGVVTSKPSLRGFSGDRFLLTKDGDETGDLSQSSIDHAISLDMTEVDQIEIVRGPRSLIYGSNTIGGVINTSLIGSASKRVGRFVKQFSIGKESFNDGLHGNGMFYIPLGNNQVNLFLSNRVTENQTSPMGELKNTQSNTELYKVGFTRYGKNSYINLIFENYNLTYGIPPSPLSVYNPDIDIVLWKETYQVNFHKDISFTAFNALDIKFDFIDYVHVELVDNDGNYNDIFDILEGDYHLGLAKKTYNYKIKLSSNNFIVGSELNVKEFIPHGLYYTPPTDEIYFSLYGFKENRIDKIGVDFLSSFRFGYLSIKPKDYDNQYKYIDGSMVNDKNFPNISFSFGVKKDIDKFEINSWIMHTMRAPRVEELFSDGPHLGTYAYEIGNPSLEAERIYGIENSISYYSNPFKFSLVTFYNYSPYYYQMAKMGHCEGEYDPYSTVDPSHPCAGEDFIDWGSGPNGFLFIYRSRGNKAEIKGLEVDFEYQINKLHLDYNFSFVQGDDKTLKMPLSYMNPTKQILSLDYKAKLINYKIRFSKIHTQERLGEFETSTSGSFLTDFIITHTYKKHSTILQLNNIFDEIHYNHLSRIKDLTPEPGMNIHLIYKVIF